MPQLVTRINDDLATAVDDLVSRGEVPSRSEAVRIALEALIDSRRRARVGRAIVEGYERVPETDEELSWAHEAGRRMIAEEPW